MDIEVARRRSHEPTAVRAGARTRMAGIYSMLDRDNMPGRITRLPCWSKERGAGRGAVGSGRWQRITLDRADSEPEPRCTVGGWVTIRGRPTTLTELFRVDSILSLYTGSSEFDVDTYPNG